MGPLDLPSTNAVTEAQGPRDIGVRDESAATRELGKPGPVWLSDKELGATKSRGRLAFAACAVIASLLAPIDLGLAALDDSVALAPILVVRLVLSLQLLAG